MKRILSETAFNAGDPAAEGSLHAEVEVLSGNRRVYIQAHDNGITRYYSASTASYVHSPEDSDDQIFEEFTSSGMDSVEENPDLFDLISKMQEYNRADNEAPYLNSEYSAYYEKADRLLDDLLEEYDEG